MDIQEFVTKSLLQIASAVKNVNEAFKEQGLTAVANPAQRFDESKEYQLIEFDLAVTVDTTSGTQGGAGVNLSVLKLGTSGASSSNRSEVSHVKFSIPLKLTHNEVYGDR